MLVRELVYVPVGLVLSFLAVSGLATIADGGSEPAEAIVSEGDDDDDDGDFDPCEELRYLKRLAANFDVEDGEDHEDFIDLQEDIEDMEIECEQSQSNANGVGAAGAFAAVSISAEPSTNFVNVNGTYDPATNTITANGIGTVAGFPNVTVALELVISDTGEIDGTYTMGAGGELPGGFPAVYGISGNGIFAEATWGDNSCSGDLGPDDALGPLLFDAGINGVAAAGEPLVCPNLGETAGGQTWGDVNCDGEVNAEDSIAILANEAQVASEPVAQCPEIGELISLG